MTCRFLSCEKIDQAFVGYLIMLLTWFIDRYLLKPCNPTQLPTDNVALTGVLHRSYVGLLQKPMG